MSNKVSWSKQTVVNTTTWSSGYVEIPAYILTEAGGYILQEDGYKLQDGSKFGLTPVNKTTWVKENV